MSRVAVCIHLGGAMGIRTPDLLIANETRYQLRQCPNNAATLPHLGNPRHATNHSA